MARNARFLGVALAALLSVAVIAGVAAGGALPEDSQLIRNWNGVAWTVTPATPPHGGSILNAVTMVSPTELWAVGSSVKPQGGTSSRPLVEHYDGAAWSPLVLPTPTPGAESDLLAVSGSSAKDVWAVGTTGHETNSTVHALIEHYNGKTWKLVPGPRQPGAELTGVAAVSTRNAWAVGYCLPHDGNGYYRTLIEHWNGSVWRRVPSPNPSGTGGASILDAVSATSARNIWAVGDYKRHRYHTLVLHWNGSRWRQVPSPTLGSKHESLLMGVVAIGPHNAWAVGSYPGTSGELPLTEHWDGKSWRVVAAPSTSSFNLLQAVSAVSATDVWAVGLDGPGKTLAEHWDGHSWTVSSTPPPVQVESFAGVAAVSATDVWAVGVSNAP